MQITVRSLGRKDFVLDLPYPKTFEDIFSEIEDHLKIARYTSRVYLVNNTARFEIKDRNIIIDQWQWPKSIILEAEPILTWKNLWQGFLDLVPRQRSCNTIAV